MEKIDGLEGYIEKIDSIKERSGQIGNIIKGIYEHTNIESLSTTKKEEILEKTRNIIERLYDTKKVIGEPQYLINQYEQK